MTQVLLGAALLLTAVAVGVFIHGAWRIWKRVSSGGPAPDRFTQLGTRAITMVSEVLSHRRFARRRLVRWAHWFVMLSFLLLVPTLAVAYFEILDPAAELPVVGAWPPWEWLIEIFSWGGLAGILVLVGVRQRTKPSPSAAPERQRRSRFFGSNAGQASFVEAVIAIVIVCVLSMRVLEYAWLAGSPETASHASWVHFPTTFWLGELFTGISRDALALGISVFAFLKIATSMTWMLVVGLQPMMGVAWHRFAAFFNIFFRREASGGPALGPLRP